jgi:hypothetical protein
LVDVSLARGTCRQYLIDGEGHLILASSARYVAPDSITQLDWSKVRHRISLFVARRGQSAVSGWRAKTAFESGPSGLTPSSIPVQYDLAAIATPHDLEAGLELCDRQTVGDDLSDVETAFEHSEHLVSNISRP